MQKSSIALVILAGLFGAIGVAAAAAGAHASGDPRLGLVSNFLLLHAAALLGAAAVGQALQLGRYVTIPAWIIAAGAVLFCGDLLVRVVFGQSPVPMAAPTGGVLLIGGWLALALGAAIGGVRGRAP